ncbi:MAG: Calx-beta domain-containing protein [Bacteroidota bacterium]
MKQTIVLLLSFFALTTINSVEAQKLKPINSIFFQGLKVPTYCGSGDTTRLPVYFQARLTGFAPSTKFKYYVSFISLKDTADSTANGVGNPLIFRNNGSIQYSSSPGFTAGNHDTITINNAGEYIGWFGAITPNDSRFAGGKYVYPMILIQEIDTLVTPIQKLYLKDSIKVLNFSASTGSDNGTGIYGNSFAKNRNMIVLYDEVGGTSRPITITMTENDGNNISNMPYFYSNKVNANGGAWGSIIPNTFSNGVKRIEVKDPKGGFLFVYANTESDATWGPDSTINPHGGLKPVYIKSDYAALTEPEFVFVSNSTNVNESNTTLKIIFKRLYGNKDSSKVNFFVVAGSATSGVDYSIVNPTKQYVFKPYGEAVDTITVNIFDDIISDPNEDVAIKLSSPVNGIIGLQSTNTINIIDNDIPSIFFTQKTIKVSEAVGSFKLRVKMITGSSTATNVKILVKSKTDSTFIPGDFKIGSSNRDTTIQFAGGKLTDSIDVTIPIIDELLAEDRNDTLVLVLRSPTSPATIGKDSLFTLIITDNDAPPIYSFATNKLSVKETAGSVKFRINISGRNKNQSDFALRYLTNSSSTTEGTDLTFNPTTTIYNVATTDPDSVIVTVPILNNSQYEPTETAIFILSPFLNAKVGKPDTLRITITDDDIIEYNISKVNTSKLTTGVADSLNTKCKLRGVVYGGNLIPSSTGIQFTLIDPTGGIQVVNSTSNKGYTVAEGDSILVTGTIGQFEGMIQLQKIDTLIKLASGRNLLPPTVTSLYNESTESKLVKLNIVKLANPSQWPTSALAANTVRKVKLVNQNDSFTLLIDSETDIDGTTAPTGFINVTGLGGQSDATNPFTSGYLIAPRRLSDIQNIVSPTFKFLSVASSTPENKDSSTAFILSASNLTNNQQVYVEIKGGTASRNTDYSAASTRFAFILSPAEPTAKVRVKYIDDVTIELPETVIFVIRGNAYGTIIEADSVHTLTIVDDESVSVKTKRLATETILYPNPTKDVLNISTTATIQTITVFDMSGKVVMTLTDINELTAIINTESLNTGIYNIKIATQEGIVTKSFSKVN